ncbi:hypothetical protein NIB75_18065 [Bacteroides uniformis]|nr:hypothetical protein [Bacteroides uniformis]
MKKKAVMRCITTHSGYPLSMTCIGYYEKLKRFVGQTFLSLAKAVETEDGRGNHPG